MLRKAEHTDMDHIIDLVYKFNTQYFDIELDPDKTEYMTYQLITNGIVFVSDNGFIGGMVVPDMFRNWTYLQELGWFSTDSSGYRLLRKFIAAAKEHEVDEIRMCTLENSNPQAEEILRRVGFSPIEQSHRLILTETYNGST